MSDNTKICPKCGTECEIGDLYCTKCKYKFDNKNIKLQENMKKVDDYTNDILNAKDNDSENYNSPKNDENEKEKEKEKEKIKYDNENKTNSDDLLNYYNDISETMDNSTYIDIKNKKIYISKEEAKNGVSKNLIFNYLDLYYCNECGGTGKIIETKAKDCPTCNGTGKVQITNNTILGRFTSSEVCPDCIKSGSITEKPCEKCKDIKEKELNIDIPAGVKNGQVLKLKEEGGRYANGTYGDVFVTVMIEDKSWVITLLLCAILGWFGAHSFYNRRIGIGILQLLTLGGLGIWLLVDFIKILTNTYTDAKGYRLSKKLNKTTVGIFCFICLLCLGGSGYKFYTEQYTAAWIIWILSIIAIFVPPLFAVTILWVLIDFINILRGEFTDGRGNLIK